MSNCCTLPSSWFWSLASFQFFVWTYTNTWRRQWHPTPVLLPGKSHGRRSLVGCSLISRSGLLFPSPMCESEKWKWSRSVMSNSLRPLVGASLHGIFQARILEWVAIAFSRRSSWPWAWTQVSHIVGRCFTIWETREVLTSLESTFYFSPWPQRLWFKTHHL